MEKNVIKFTSELSQKEITLTIDENLNKLKGKVLAPKKLEKANEDLKGLKLPQTK